MTTRREKGIFKMAVARTRAMVSESFDSFVAPVIQKSVPNHLLETSKNIRKYKEMILVFLGQIFVVIFTVIFLTLKLCFCRNLCQSWAKLDCASQTIGDSLCWISS